MMVYVRKGPHASTYHRRSLCKSTRAPLPGPGEIEYEEMTQDEAESQGLGMCAACARPVQRKIVR